MYMHEQKANNKNIKIKNTRYTVGGSEPCKPPLIGPPKGINKEIHIFFLKLSMVRFFLEKWSGLNFYVLEPENSDSSSKNRYIVLFPGLNSTIHIKIPQT